MRIGLDVGSTTLKCVVLNDADQIVYQNYERHLSRITEKTAQMLSEIAAKLGAHEKVTLCISGSAGMGLADDLGIPFVQEVYATRLSVSSRLPGTDVVIELGGEDAKILFLSGGMEVRMNGSCAGGTGAFIDQMATLLDVTPGELNELAKTYDKIYTIASRCGVFAKSDIQPLLNQGAVKNDIAASILAAVVNQTVAGLAQGRKIEGKVVYLGGPLTFLSELRRSFDRTLGVSGVCPDDSLYFVALGAAMSPDQAEADLSELTERVRSYTAQGGYQSCAPLFSSQEEYNVFRERHDRDTVPVKGEYVPGQPVYVGIDAGSTTVKAVALHEDETILCSSYMSGNGNPVELVKEFLAGLYQTYPGIHIAGAASTGYGEELMKNAFRLDGGLVETVAHFKAARKFRPDVDFIMDIGGQDIKCFQIRNGAIDNIFLNEACSSGCGSFLQTFAATLGYAIADFAKLGLFADRPVDLGSRCTVFMNSSVKQAQKDGASVENISAGLSVSVVKNALYKVIRAASADDLGRHIVVQGGTFLNDAVLRAFEQEIGRDVVRPNIAGLMGAFGAALYAKERSSGQSSILTAEALTNFSHSVKVVPCNGCSNHCRLTVNAFDGGRRFIGGNRCERPLLHGSQQKRYNLFEYKRSLLQSYRPQKGPRGRIGIPMGLNLFELLPFWHTFFTKLGFEVAVSPPSSRSLYLAGQNTIPSDTVCYPAKLLHGHIQALLDEGVETVFYPCMSYNLDEGLGDNHYNCPVVAYYPEVVGANMPGLKSVRFISDYVGLHRPRDFVKKMQTILSKYFDGISLKEVQGATDAAFDEYHSYLKRVREKGAEYLDIAREKKLPVIILAGRPYHLDQEINHGIDTLICDLGAVVITEDSVSALVEKFPTGVLNQWTYHSRLYAAAKYVCDQADPQLNLVQLVSFGCGVDAITTDEVRSILEEGGRIHTQIKIDEITNLGAVKIRLRSLFAALEQAERS